MKTNPSSLPLALRHGLPVAVALALAVLSSACGGKSEGTDDPSGAGGSASDPASPGNKAQTPAPSAMLSPSFCANGPTADDVDTRIFDALTPVTPPDYLALRRVEVSLPTPREQDPGLVTMKERGTKCAGASDPAACTKAYGRLETDHVWFPYVFFTRGDRVGIVTTRAAGMALIGTVDSPEEAYFVARLGGARFECGGADSTGYRAVDGGFELLTRVGGCGKPVEHVVVRVYTDGTTEEISRVTTEPETRSCPQP